jgi:hypothetical protein
MKKLYFLFLLTLISFSAFSQNPGDIVITEIMKNPALVSDNYGEWFEVHNSTSTSIDLQNWVIRDQPGGSQNSTTITNSVIVPAGGYIAMGRGGVTDSSASDFNGGLTYAYVYDSSFSMSNGSDEVILEAPDGSGGFTVIDEVFYSDANFPDSTGVSMQLDSAALTSDNNDGSNWCNGTQAYNGQDIGTPGSANNTCDPVCEASLGSATANCDAITTGTDTYSVTLAFSGAGTTTFVVTSTTGTVSGDNPSTNVTGNIIVSGISEGTDVTITMDDTANGGLCALTREVTSLVCEPTGSVDIELIGVMDFTVSTGGSTGKAHHLVATADNVQLSDYGLGSANNGGGTDGEEFSLPAGIVNNGDNILVVRDAAAIEAYFTTAGYNLFDLVIVDTGGDVVNGNGNDAIELYKNGSVVETFGDITDSSAADWNYLDSWAYKTTLGAAWPTGWSYGGVDCTDGSTTIFDSSCVYPFLESLSTKAFSKAELSIYPNPVNNGLVTIKSPLAGVKNIELFDAIGRNVLKTELTAEALDVSKLGVGLYLLKVTIGDRSAAHKLIIN